MFIWIVKQVEKVETLNVRIDKKTRRASTVRAARRVFC